MLIFCTLRRAFTSLKVSQMLGVGRKQFGAWRQPDYKIDPWCCIFVISEELSSTKSRAASNIWRAGRNVIRR